MSSNESTETKPIKSEETNGECASHKGSIDSSNSKKDFVNTESSNNEKSDDSVKKEIKNEGNGSDDSEELCRARKDSGIDYEGDDAVDDDSASVESSESSEAESLTKEEIEQREKLEKEEEATFEEQRRKQVQSLENLRTNSEMDVDASSKLSSSKRMDFLMAQSDVFTQFLMGGSSVVGKAMSKRKKADEVGLASPNRRGRKKDDTAEAQAMLAMEESRFTRLDKQPNNIVHGTMKPYQIEGLNWLIRLHDCGVNGILADEMGLGKTLQTISLLGYLREARGTNGPHLIIVPKSTTGNWMKELKRWCPSIRALKFMGNKEERVAIREQVKKRNFDVCVLSYEVTIIEKGTLRQIPWKYLIIDEAHRIKNEKSKLSLVVRDFKVNHRLLITGTPLQNNLHELWALLNFLLPDIFSDSEDFNQWFNIEEEASQQNVIKKLHTILRPFLLRRLKSDVAKSLPPKTESKLYVGISEMQRQWYTSVLHRDATHLNAIGGSDRVRLLNILMQLRKVCNHPYLFEGAEPKPYVEGSHLWDNCGKLTLLHKLLPKLKSQGSRVLIFCQMTSMLDILEDFLRYHHYEYCRIDGSTKGDDRDEAMDVFNAEGSSKFCFLLSTRAGGLGINLATADIVVLYDSDWNPQVDLQAMDRAHRIGQTKPVRVFRFISEGTVEEKIVERAERKLYLDAAVIQQGRLAEQNRKLSKDELMTMVRFGADEIFNSKGSTITDEDIDAILARGEERTENMKEKIAGDMQHNLRDFSLTGDVSNLYEFEGELFAKEDTGQILPSTFIALPQRERKKNYNEDEYYRTATGQKPKTQREPRQPKAPNIYDFQFFDADRLSVLYEKRNEIEIKRRDKMKQIKDQKKKEKEAATENETEDKTTLLSERMEKELEKLTISTKQLEEIQKLEANGFGDWTRRDLKQFVSSCERYGRDEEEKICNEVAALCNKDLDRVKQYYATFWERYTEIKEHQKILDKISRGEKRIERNLAVKDALAAKCAKYKVPWRDMQLTYPSGSGNIQSQSSHRTGSHGFVMEEDVFLICLMNKYGYGCDWTEIKDEIRKAWQFRFDWFIKSRTVSELQKRGDYLTRLIEKENEELNNRHKKDEKEQKDKLQAAQPSSSSKKRKNSSSKKSSSSNGSSKKSKKRTSSSKSKGSSKKHRSK